MDRLERLEQQDGSVLSLICATEDLNPSDTRQTLTLVPLGESTIVDQAVEAAQQASASWRAATGPARAEVLHCVANSLAGVREQLGRMRLWPRRCARRFLIDC